MLNKFIPIKVLAITINNPDGRQTRMLVNGIEEYCINLGQITSISKNTNQTYDVILVSGLILSTDLESYLVLRNS